LTYLNLIHEHNVSQPNNLTVTKDKCKLLTIQQHKPHQNISNKGEYADRITHSIEAKKWDKKAKDDLGYADVQDSTNVL